jgi:serine/threonine-protein kinase
MRLVEGESLKTAIERYHKQKEMLRDSGEEVLALRKLLARFQDVCNAVGYAHSRGVVHRDLKPSNIMLGPYGETLVVDWGLAKAYSKAQYSFPSAKGQSGESPGLGGESIPTHTGALLGTPVFMSPEQAAEEPGKVGPASDVYSLGATLFSLLTGRAAFEAKDANTLLLKVRTGNFPKPREVDSSIPPALEAICLKAMKLRPEDRYESPSALADSIEHWLADEPIPEYREPWTIRLGRWLRWHKPLVAGAAVLLASGMVGLMIDDIRVGSEKARAGRNFLLAREAVNRVLAQVAEGRLAAVPQAEDLRLQVASDALEFNERFLQQEPRNREVRQGAALVFRQVASIHRMLGQSKAAGEDYRRAIELLEPLNQEFPGEMAYSVDLALALSDRGEALQLAGYMREAESSARRHWQLPTDFRSARRRVQLVCSRRRRVF